MVREVKLSPDCPPLPVDHESLLDEEFPIVDDWKCRDESPSMISAESSRPPRNLADAAIGKPVAVKSRRGRRGRRAAAPASKQISIALPYRDWRMLRDEAARERIPIAKLCRRWLRPHLDQLEFQWGETIEKS